MRVRPPRPNRRDFIRTGLAAATIPWGWRTGILGANDKLRVACIGVGGRGEGNVAGVEQEDIVAICDVDRGRLDACGEKHKGAKRFVDYRELIETVNLDAVVIATPDHHHAPASFRALKKGLHVYCEKPLTHTVHEARVLTRLAREKGLVTQLGTQNHEHPVNLQAMEILRQGLIGEVREVHVITDRPGGWWKQGLLRPTDRPECPKTLEWDLWLGPAPERPYHPDYVPFSWRGWWDFGCGAVGDMAIHLMDLAVWGLDLRAPTRVSARGSAVSPESGPTWMIALFEHAARDGRPPCRVWWYEGTAKPPAGIAGDLPMNGSLFIGDAGRLAVDHTNKVLLLPEERFKGSALPKPTLPKSPGHHRQWLDAIRGKGKASCDFAYAGPFTEQVLLANVAYRTGKTLYWNPASMAAFDLPEAAPLIRKTYRKGWEVG